MDREPLGTPMNGPHDGSTVDASGHHGQQCPFVNLVTPELVLQIEDAIEVARHAGRAELSDRLGAWLVRITRVVATVREGGDCGSELWLG